MPLCRSPLTLRLALFSRSRTAAVEIPRFILHRRRSEFLPLHRGAEGAPAPYTDLPQAGGPHPSRCGLRRTAPPSPRGRLCAPRRVQGLPRCETQHYNPSVAPKARQLPLHRGAENAHSPVLKPVLKAKAPCSSPCSKQKPRAQMSTGLFFV